MIIYKILAFLMLLCCSQHSLASIGRVITLNSALTETVFALGYGARIVATDVTSVSPAAATRIPKISRSRALSSEVLLAYQPDLILAAEAELPKSVAQQLRRAGIQVVFIEQAFSVKGAVHFIRAVGNALDLQAKGKTLADQVELEIATALQQVQINMRGKQAKILFIYARGTGTMSVAGKGSSIDAIIRLAGGKNAITEFSDYKPYTTEALVQANPDIILLFDFGLSSLGGKEALLKMPGVALTNAGKQQNIIPMPGALLINFSSRLPEAILALNKQIIASL